jgi:hypothetical protein
MPETHDPAPDDEPIADVEQLFQDEAPARPRPPSTGGQRGESVPEAYELEGGEPETPRSPPPTFDDVAFAPTPLEDAERPARRVTSLSGTVDQVWSRNAEWGPNLLVIAGCGFLLAFLVYQAMSAGDLMMAIGLLLVGGAVMAVLSYPIMITLERPVRITPEQAVKDFYAALSHHLPHYRRMWLLLSSAGRRSVSFASYQGFKNYWKGRISQLRGDRAGGMTPLVFKVEEFKSEKSAGLTSIEVKFVVNVFPRGKQNQAPLDSIRVTMGLVKGPDKMWYLNKGTLP